MWFTLGSAGGSDEARLRLSNLERGMTPAQVAEGRTRANTWLTQPQLK